MPAQTPSASRTLVWLLAILLIGVMALYGWHNDNQMKTLADKDTEIEKSAELLADKEKELGQAQQEQKSLRAEVQALTARFESEKKELIGELNAAGQASQDLQKELEALKIEDAEILAAEKEKATRAFAQLQGQLDSANQQTAALEANIEQLKRAMTEAESAHEVQVQQIEQELGERIAYYRTALEGSDPERADQLASLGHQIQAAQESLEESRQAMQAREADFTQRLARANQAIAERDQGLADAEQMLDDLQNELTQSQSALGSLQQQHDMTVVQAAEELSAARQQIEAAETAHAKTKSEAAAATQAAEAEIAHLGTKLQAETAALLALQQRHDSMVTELEGSLENTRQTLSDVEAQLASAREAAVQTQQAHEKQIGEARSKIESLEAALAQTKEQAAADLTASKQEREEEVEYVRGVYTEFSKLGGRHTDRGMLLSLAEEELRFRISKADLPEGNLPSLDWIAELLIKHPKLSARIEGHTDSKGREETNLELSQLRAEAVKKALIERGVPIERMTAEGIGAARPIADNATSAGRRENRRVEVYVLEDQ